MEGPYSMVGYYEAESPRPFVRADVDMDLAKAEATAKELERFVLLPHRHPYQHRAYIRVGPGKYEQMRTRLFVFTHLLTRGNDWMPTEDEVRTGKKNA